MKAIILAAGRGTRLHPLTLEKPKGLLPVGDSTILDRMVSQLREFGVKDILMVTGHQEEILKEHFGESIRYKTYSNFASTNNLHTLESVSEELNEDVIITFADLYLAEDIMRKLVESKNEYSFVVDTTQVLEATMRVKTNGVALEGITRVDPADATGNFIGISKIKSTGLTRFKKRLKEAASEGHENDYYTVVVDDLIKEGVSVNSLDIKGDYWCEIDTKNEYDELCTYAIKEMREKDL